MWSPDWLKVAIRPCGNTGKVVVLAAGTGGCIGEEALMWLVHTPAEISRPLTPSAPWQRGWVLCDSQNIKPGGASRPGPSRDGPTGNSPGTAAQRECGRAGRGRDLLGPPMYPQVGLCANTKPCWYCRSCACASLPLPRCRGLSGNSRMLCHCPRVAIAILLGCVGTWVHHKQLASGRGTDT